MQGMAASHQLRRRSPAVEFVAQEWMPDARHVHANLVSIGGADPQLHECQFRMPARDTIRRFGLAPRIVNSHLFLVLGVRTQGKLDVSFVGEIGTAYHREIAFHETTRAQQSSQLPSRLVGV